MPRGHLSIVLLLCAFACKSPETDGGATTTSETGDDSCPSLRPHAYS